MRVTDQIGHTVPGLPPKGAPLQVTGPNFRAGGVEGRPRPSDSWRTPPDLYARLDEEFRFVVDVACERDNCLAPFGLFHDEGIDALTWQWSITGGAVWCNPPYSRIRPWLEHASEEGRRCVVVVLAPVDTSTRWWLECVAKEAAEVRFLTGRVKFHLANGCGEHKTGRGGGGLVTGSALVIYSPTGGPPRYSYMPARARSANP
jgi:phage N-6-adenine-methyltransferase